MTHSANMEMKMTSDNSSLRKLAMSSLRHNRGVLVLLGVVVLSVGTCFWLVQRMLEEEVNKVGNHFARLIDSLNENRTFLHSVATEVRTTKDVADRNKASLQSSLAFHNEEMSIFEVKEFSFSTPYSVAFNEQQVNSETRESAFTFGKHLADFYSGFWSGSVYPTPQLFLLAPNDEFTLAVPAIGAKRGHLTSMSLETYLAAAERVREHLRELKRGMKSDQVYWINAWPLPSTHQQIFASIAIEMTSRLLPGEGRDSGMQLVSLIDVGRLNDTPRLVAPLLYDDLTLLSPSGQVLMGAQTEAQPSRPGVSFSRDGLKIKVAEVGGEGWSALYNISYERLLGYAKWPLLGILCTFLSSLFLGWKVNRWYLIRIVLPAERAHRKVQESEAFSRAVIDTAPIGLCVVRQSDHQMLLGNRRAHEWLGDSQFISRLVREQGSHYIGEACVGIDRRYLHVSFGTTRYQEQDVIVCAFSDVTSHKEDAAELTRAKHQAEVSSQAKTTFLATMSHEIRTPLYGVLGTLELLALTSLDQRQEAYLNTIEHSSSALLQLISDILDVSKIESGQMALDTDVFCPLDVVEDLVEAHAAAAESKGLQIYACIDVNVPDRMEGDHFRIRQILNNLLNNAIKFTDFGRVVLRLKVLESKSGRDTLQWQVTDTGVGISQAHQVRLFEPFYQVLNGHSSGGTGLGLSICSRLSQLMGGQMRVVSEPGLGSSFNLILNLRSLPGALAGIEHLSLSSVPIYVHAPFNELAEITCAWLKRWGGHALVVPQGPINTLPGAVLLDLMPGSNSPSCWNGPRVSSSGYQNQPEYYAEGWRVGVHRVRAIARAVMLAQQGSISVPQRQAPIEREKLDLRVLVAEDNPINQTILKEQLEELGCRVVIASHGQEALSLWSPQAFDVVLTDVNMPIMNGYELASAIRQEDSDIPIIGVTANAMREEDELCMAVGMNARMVKPMTLQTLRNELVKSCCLEQCGVSFNMPGPALEKSVFVTLEVEPIVVSDKLRQLFTDTMRADIATARQALVQEDAKALKERLHCICGALAVVQATALAKACGELEVRLEGVVWESSLSLLAEPLLARLEQAVANI